ncbi:unnamed protein product [Rotaria sp. Silwood2]|nr:unnamed protein product [Rotaria sp. Silwood2]
MSVPSKSIDKNKRYAGVKANDFVNKARTNETSRAAARTQGWANLGKINSRRIPPPANLPSLKSETGTTPATFDPTIPTGTSHGWTASGNQTPTNLANNQTRPLTPSKQPTQQQLDSIPAIVSTPPPLPSSSSTLSSDIDKPRGGTTWSTVTAGNTTGNTNDQPPNLLGLNDFPRLVTQDNKNTKSQSDSLINSISTTTQGPSLRPANLASWKEGGGRAQPMSNDLTKESNDNNNNNTNNNNLSTLSMQSQMLPTNTNNSLLQSQIQNPNNSSYMRMYQQQQQQPQQQMWSYNMGNSYGPYGTNQAPAQMSMHQLHHHHQQQQRMSPYGNNVQNQSQQRHNTSTDYKTPTILRNKDIDDLSKLTDNVTWASASQEVNYEEKIRFSDDEDNDITDKNNKSRRFNHSQQQSKQTYPQVLQNNNTNNNRTLHTNYSQQQTTRSRLLHDDEHVKQMQDDKNSELINTLTVAKQRRDEQERNLRDNLSHRTTTTNVQKSFDDQKQIPGYQTRPLLTSTGQDNLTSSSQIDSSSLWGQSNPTTTTTTAATTTTTTTTTSRPRHDTTDSQTFAMKTPPQNNAIPPPPMPSYPSPFLVDHGGHMISQPQPPPHPSQAYMNNQMMSGRPQGAPYYRTPPQQQLQTPPAPPYGTQDPLAHGGFYAPFFQPPNSNAPPVGHPSPHNLYGQNEGFHHAHAQMFARAGSIDRNDHPLMSQPPPPPQSLSRPTNYPSTSSNQQQQGPPPSLLSQNLKSFHTNQQQTSSSNQAQFYPPPPNQYARQPMPIGAMNTTNNRQQTQQVPSLMSGLSKNFSNNGNNLNNTQSLFQHRQPLIPPQSNNNRPLYQHHPTQYSNYSKSTGPNDDNVKPKHI